MKTILLLTSLCISIISFGQNNFEEVVYLKNGSIIRGLIIENVPNQTIKIQTKDRSVFVFKMEEVEKITKEFPDSDLKNEEKKSVNDKGEKNEEAAPKKVNMQKNNLPQTSKEDELKEHKELPYKESEHNFKRRGYMNVTEVSYLRMGLGTSFPISSVLLNTVNGYQFNPHWSIGGGFGILLKDGEINSMIATFDMRVSVLKYRVSPVIGLRLGADLYNKEPLINPSIGVRTYFANRVAVVANIGLLEQIIPGNIFKSTETQSSLVLSIGFLF